MFLSKLAVRKPVLTTMLVSVFVVMGLFSYTRLTTELFPEVAFPVITVTTLYPGAGPNEVQSQLTELIEDEVVAISNVKRVNATSQEGVSVVLVEFELGVDVDLAAIEVKDKVDAIRFLLPEDSEPPSVVKFDIAATPVMDVTLSGARPVEELFQLADTQVKDAFARVGGVSSVTLVGGKEREIEVALNNRKLQDYDLSITDVVGAIAAANLSVPAGTIIQKDAEYGLRMVGEFTSVEELNEVYLINRRNETISLTDIGVVRDTFKDQRELARFNGNTSVGLTIQKRSDANVIETADGLNKEIAALRAALPSDISIDIISDGSTFIRSSVRDVLISIVVGIGLTSVILFLFLHNVRATIIAAIAMPTSIVATFILLDFAGFTLNLMSLLGLGISLGTLVANAIVVLENIARHVQEGKDPKDAAEIGTDEMVVAVLAATMTNVMVFTPIAFMAGLVGQFFRQFGLTVVFATLFSLLVSFTLTPMLASRLLRPASATKRKSLFSGAFRAWDAMYGLLERGYRGSLAWSLSHRVIVLGMTALVFAGGIYLFKFVGSEFVPTFDQGLVRVGLEMPAGTSLERTNLALERIEEIAAKVPEARDLYTTLGGGGGATGVEFGQVVINLKEDRQRDGTVILADLRESLVGTIPDAQLTFDLSQGSGGGGQADITIDVTGLELEPLSQLADAVTLAAKETPGTADVRASHKSGKPELAVQLDRRKLGELKLSVAQVGSALRTNYSGAIASTYREAGEEYDIRVR
ncbi:MAG: efflux RND transporter permease subunit, partial [Candidatus Poribacteria bacterium]|nr:efflux RND transporter permease subunit [Candidatus Poribacteria bacterium]